MNMKSIKFIALSTTLLLGAVFSITHGYTDVNATGYTPTEFTIANKYNYRAKAKFEMTVDSIEAWVKLPTNSLGGVIMGTWSGYDTQYQGFNLEVDALGRIKYVYNANAYNYTFAGSDVMDGRWHHVALVRDASVNTLSLYIDGILNESHSVLLQDTYPQQKLYIGVNPCFWNRSTKYPLEGSIKQVTIYSGPISQERIQQDMEDEKISNDDTNAILMANWFFGETWTQRYVPDTSSFKNDCHLETHEKYVGLDDNRDFDYSFVILPDVQCMNRYKHDRFSKMVDWLVNNKDQQKIKFLMAVGDLSDVGTEEQFYRDCSLVLNKLNGKIPWSFIPGNHDYDDNCKESRSTNFLNKYFPYSIHSKLPGFGGCYENGKMENTYYIHNVDGIKYCVINLEFGPRMEVLRWANRICEQFSDHRVIVQTHAYMDPTGQYTNDRGAENYKWADKISYTIPADFYNQLVKRNKNLFMAVGGHYSCDDIMYVPSTGINGNKIHSFLVDNQGTMYEDEGIGQDAIGIFKVNEAKKIISVYYYSPHYDAVFNIQNQYDFYFGDAVNTTIGL